MARPDVVFGEKVAAQYEDWYETPEGKRADELEKASLRRLLNHFPQADSVLEIGCGTAHFTYWLHDRGTKAVGLDLSRPMLREAQSWTSVPLVRGEAVRLPFSDGAFDLITLITTLEFLDRPREAVGEALRIARYGLLLGVLNRWSVLGFQRRLEGCFRPTVYDTARFYSVGELKRLLRRVSGDRAQVVWYTTLFPGWIPWQEAKLPWGGFIAMALVQ